MPTRAIGDLRLKLKEFNFHNKPVDQGYRHPIPNYTGPYITCEPDIQVFDLDKNDEWLIIATDGLWDEIKRKTTPSIVKDCPNS